MQLNHVTIESELEVNASDYKAEIISLLREQGLDVNPETLHLETRTLQIPFTAKVLPSKLDRLTDMGIKPPAKVG